MQTKQKQPALPKQNGSSHFRGGYKLFRGAGRIPPSGMSMKKLCDFK